MGLFKDLLNIRKSIAEYEKVVQQLETIKTQTEENIESLKKETFDANEQKNFAVNNRHNELTKTTEQCLGIIKDYEERTESAKAAYCVASEQTQEMEKVLATAKQETEKELTAIKQKTDVLEARAKIYRQLITRINNKSLSGEDISAEQIELARLVPTVEINLHSFEIKSLRSLYNENNKVINSVLSKYEVRYNTKTNKALYQLMVLALQSECQNILVNMKYGTLEKAKSQLKEMLSKYSKIAADGNQTIAPTVKAFINEIDLLFEKAIEIEYTYYEKKEQAKAEQLALKEQMRQDAEEAKLLAKEREKVEKEEAKFRIEIENLQQSIGQDSSKNESLENRIAELEQQLLDVEKKKSEIINLQNGKAGKVYIISNLGSFGENVFKIGMTRRSEPQDRINELGDASVPFSFDVHSFIFSQDAVKLESDIHHILAAKRVNKINTRKEFFYADIDELEKLVYELEPSAMFNKTMAAEQYRQSLSFEEGEVLPLLELEEIDD